MNTRTVSNAFDAGTQEMNTATLKVCTVNHPPHYTQHPSRVECIAITEHFNFCIGNAIKYLWRAGLKCDAIEDLQKAKWYIEREIERVKA